MKNNLICESLRHKRINLINKYLIIREYYHHICYQRLLYSLPSKGRYNENKHAFRLQLLENKHVFILQLQENKNVFKLQPQDNKHSFRLRPEENKYALILHTGK